jgi:hypothetical protein
MGCSKSIDVQKLKDFKSQNEKILLLVQPQFYSFNAPVEQFNSDYKDLNLSSIENLSIKFITSDFASNDKLYKYWYFGKEWKFLDKCNILDDITNQYISYDLDYDRIYILEKSDLNNWKLSVYANGQSLLSIGNFNLENVFNTILDHNYNTKFDYEKINRETLNRYLKSLCIENIEKYDFVYTNGTVMYNPIYSSLNIVDHYINIYPDLSTNFINKIKKYPFHNSSTSIENQELFYSEKTIAELKEYFLKHYSQNINKLSEINDWLTENSQPANMKKEAISDLLNKNKILFESNFNEANLVNVNRQFAKYKDELSIELSNNYIDYLLPLKVSVNVDENNYITIRSEFEINTDIYKKMITFDRDNEMILDFYKIIFGIIKYNFIFDGYFTDYETTLHKKGSKETLTLNYYWNRKNSRIDIPINDIELELIRRELIQYHNPLVLISTNSNKSNISKLVDCFEHVDDGYTSPYFRLNIVDSKHLGKLQNNYDLILNFFDIKINIDNGK